MLQVMPWLALHAPCMRPKTMYEVNGVSNTQFSPPNFSIYVKNCLTRCMQKAHFFCFNMSIPFVCEFRLVSIPITKERLVVAKIWFSTCVENLGRAVTVETNSPEEDERSGGSPTSTRKASFLKTATLIKKLNEL